MQVTWICTAVVMVKLSVCSPSTLTIWVRIPLKFCCKIVVEKNHMNEKEAVVAPFEKTLIHTNLAVH